MTNDTFHTYTHDAEGRLLTVDGGVGNGGETYNYNSRSLRNLTHQGVWEEVLYNVDGSQEATVLPGTNTLEWSEFYAYRHIGTFTAGGLNTTLFLLPDWLGTNRYWMTEGGAYFTSSATLPYGEILSPGIGDGWTGISGLFLDYADDTVHTYARQLSLNSGRWHTADPAIMLGNRYAYVENNPVSFTDPTGLVRTPWGIFGGNVSFLGTASGFDLMGIPVYGPKWIPFPLNQPGPSFPVPGGIATTQLTDGYYLGWGVIGNGLDLFGGGNSGVIEGGSPESFWQRVKNVARTIGNYIPTPCGGGVYNYGGLQVSNGVSNVAVSQMRVADSRAGYLEGPFGEFGYGEGIVGGVGQATFNTGNETFVFGGVGGDGSIGGASLTAFGTSTGSVGYNLEGEIGPFKGGVGIYQNFDSLTSCIDNGGH